MHNIGSREFLLALGIGLLHSFFVDPPPKAITISINEKGEVAWDAQIISLDELQTRFQEAAKAEKGGAKKKK